MDGNDRVQPKPKGPFPAPESYETASCGPNSERPGLVRIGRVKPEVPVTGLAANFSPIPRIAPPPLGSDTLGAATPNELDRFAPGKESVLDPELLSELATPIELVSELTTIIFFLCS